MLMIMMSTIMMSTFSTTRIRRGAFDIGSGSIKLQVSDVLVGQTSSFVEHTHFAAERPCAFGSDYLKATDGDGKLSETIQEKGRHTLHELFSIGEALGCTQYSAVATAVFRKASNGEAFLKDAVHEALGIRVAIVTHELEAQLGYSTAQAVSKLNNCIAWDTGGGSFQIIRKNDIVERSIISTNSVVSSTQTDSSCASVSIRGDISKKDHAPVPSSGSSSPFQMYLGSIGSGFANKTLVEDVRGGKIGKMGGKPLNPVSFSDAEMLMKVLVDHMRIADKMGDSGVGVGGKPTWLLDADNVVAIGGPNSAFQLVCNVLTSLQQTTRPDGIKYNNLKRKDRSASMISDMSLTSTSTSTTSDTSISDSGIDQGQGLGVDDIDIQAIDDDFSPISSPSLPPIDSFTISDVRSALIECCDKTDGYLQEKYQPYLNSDPSTIIVPKLVLLWAVMSHTQMKRVRAISCMGMCPGMLITESLWS